MYQIPSWARSSVDQNSVSLTIVSIGKAVTGVITFLGIIGMVDPLIAGEAWGNFVTAVITAIPAGFAVYHTGQAVWGLARKAMVAAFTKSTPAV